MKQTRILMGMPVTIEVVDEHAQENDLDVIYDYFISIDERFSTYKTTSEISAINRGEISSDDYSDDMREVFMLSEQTKQETQGYFDIKHDGVFDPSGLVKGWAILNAAQLLRETGFRNFYVDAGGDVQVFGKNNEGIVWQVGIRNPFNRSEIVKVVQLQNQGIATSGTYIRGDHIYNPLSTAGIPDAAASLTVIGPNVYEADRFATAAFAMGKQGIHFIESKAGLEGYSIDKAGIATYTTGFEQFISNQ
jgi:thiamine biosynthesis lipoprotein